MWIFWVLIAVAAIAWLGYSWVETLLTKFEHTFLSRVLLLFLGAAGFLTGLRITKTLAPQWSTGPVLAVSTVPGFAAFCLYSYIGVNFWLSILTKDYDRRITAMEQEEDALVRRLEAHRWSVIRGYPEEEPEESQEEKELAALRKLVEGWEKGGGVARVRSLKVLEWRSEIAKMALLELNAQLREAETGLYQEKDPVKAEQSRVRIALLKMERLERQMPSGSPEEPAEKVDLSDPSQVRNRLQELHREVGLEKARKAEFLRSRVRLSWRVRK